jgi:hypothetical protein
LDYLKNQVEVESLAVVELGLNYFLEWEIGSLL